MVPVVPPWASGRGVDGDASDVGVKRSEGPMERGCVPRGRRDGWIGSVGAADGQGTWNDTSTWHCYLVLCEGQVL